MSKFTGYDPFNYLCFFDKHWGKNQFMWWRKFHHQVCASEDCFCQNLQLHGPGTEDRCKKTFEICTSWPGLYRSEVLPASVWFFVSPKSINSPTWLILRIDVSFFIIFWGCFIFWDFNSGASFREANVISADVKK